MEDFLGHQSPNSGFFYMLVCISIFRVLLVNHVNIMFIFVSVISSKPGMEMDYKNPLIHPARDERYSEVTKMTNHYLMIISQQNYFFQKYHCSVSRSPS